MRQVTYKIRGMDCVEEVIILKKEIGPLVGGEENLAFNILNGKMMIQLQNESFDPAVIINTVSRMGMEAVPWSEDGFKDDGDESAWHKHNRLIMCVTSGVFIISGFVTSAIHSGGILAAWMGSSGSDHYFCIPAIILYFGAVVTGGCFIAPKAYFSARRLKPDMNLLMTIAVLGAMVLGEWFEAGTVTFLFSLALLLESWSVGQARRAISGLMDLAPTKARYICPNDGDIEEKPVDQVPKGVTVLVRPGEKIPLDGIVTKGTTTVNQAAITGESIPVSKSTGDEVFAGTINNDGAFEFTTTRTANDTTLARIIRLVEEAHSRKAVSEQWVEKFARYYTPIMMVFALIMAIVPPLFLGKLWGPWIYQGLVIMVIACPCALVISTPVSIVAGLASAARAGVLIKGGVYLELPARLKAIAMDKTGTLTMGKPEVQEIIPYNHHTPRELLSIAATLETHSEHPLAKAILAKARSQVPVLESEGFQAVKGKGAQARIYNKNFWIGSHRYMHEMGKVTPEIHHKVRKLEDAGHTMVAIGTDDHICGLISIADEPRPNAASMIKAIKDSGVKKVVMLTGDNPQTASAVAQLTGIDEFKANLLPEDKVAIVDNLVQERKNVGMIGDGINDAPAMAAATVGIAMGAAGTDVAIETADIALMSDDLTKVPWLIKHSRSTLRIIKQNIWFALGVKALFMVLALAGKATLWMAIAADMGASLLVIFNSLRLLNPIRRKL